MNNTFLQVVKHPSKVIEVQMRKPGFKAQAGQVINLPIKCFEKIIIFGY